MREKIMGVFEENEGVVIVDARDVDWSTFTYSGGFVKHYVTDVEVLKPYLISLRYYGSSEYEDIILLLNNIVDPFGMVVGSEIKIPKLDDIKSFIYEHRVI